MAAPIYSNAISDVEAVKDTILVTAYFEIEKGKPEVVSRLVLTRWAALMLMAGLDRAVREPAASASVTPFPKKKRPAKAVGRAAQETKK